MRLNTRPWCPGERGEDLELDVGQAHRAPADMDIALVEVDAQVARLDRLLTLVLGLGQRGPAEDRLDAAAELPDGEGLRDVVVGAQLQAEHLVDLLGLGGQHDDGHGAAGADPAADVEAVELGQHHVQHDEVEAAVAQARESLPSVQGRDHVVALLAQRIREQLLDRSLIVDEQYARRSALTFEIVG